MAAWTIHILTYKRKK